MRKHIPYGDEGNFLRMISTQVLWELFLYILFTYILTLALSLIVPSSFTTLLSAQIPLSSPLAKCTVKILKP